MSEPLWRAVDDLTKPRHVKLLRDHGASDWTTVPSLWWLLEDALNTGLEAGKLGGGSRYRTPLNIDALQLARDIADTVMDALAGHDQQPRSTVPDSLRALASVVTATNDDDLIGWWTYRVRAWCRQIDHTLRLTEAPQPRGIRGTACPTCMATHVTRTGPDGPERVSALFIDFTDGLIRAASCQACGSSWFRGQPLLDLHDAIEAQRAASETVA